MCPRMCPYFSVEPFTLDKSLDKLPLANWRWHLAKFKLLWRVVPPSSECVWSIVIDKNPF